MAEDKNKTQQDSDKQPDKDRPLYVISAPKDEES
jgi:hypothetical protein